MLRTLFGLLIAALFIFFAFRGISFKSLIQDAVHANIYILILTTVVVLFDHFLRALRWRVILREVKKDISVVDTWGAIMVGYLVNNFVPRLGELVRAYTTGRLEGVPVSGVFGTIVLERLLDMLSAGILLGIALATYGGNIIGAFPFLRLAGVVLIVGSVTVGAVLYVAATVRKANEILIKLAHLFVPKRLRKRAEGIIASFLSSFSILHSPKSILWIVFYTALVWIVYVFTMYIPFFAFKSASMLTFYDAFILILIASIAWMIPSPGALGVYHLFVSQAMTRFFNVPSDESLAYATLTHLFGYVAITIVGAVFAFIFSQRLKIRSVGKLLDVEEKG